jgi:excisionase family DNA binding protein
MTTLGDLPTLSTVRELARFFRVGEPRIYRAIARGELPAVRVGKSIRVYRDALERWLNGSPAPGNERSATGSPSAALREASGGLSTDAPLRG